MNVVLLQAATDGGGGITIPLAWLLTLAAAGITGAFTAGRILLSRIEKQYLTQIADLKEMHARELSTCTRRIEKLEAAEGETLALFRKAVEAAGRQADVSEAMFEQRAASPRRTRAGTGSD